MNQINLNDARKKKVPTKQEAKEIIQYLKDNPNDEKAVPTLMEKYNCTETSIIKIIIKDGYRS